MRTTRTNEHDSNVLLSSCTAEDQKKRTGRKRFCWLLIPASAFLLAALLNLFVIICAVVPSASMADTIREGALMVASRLAYVGGEPGRGDVVLFRHEELGGSLIVKRVVAPAGGSGSKFGRARCSSTANRWQRIMSRVSGRVILRGSMYLKTVISCWATTGSIPMTHANGQIHSSNGKRLRQRRNLFSFPHSNG